MLQFQDSIMAVRLCGVPLMWLEVGAEAFKRRSSWWAIMPVCSSYGLLDQGLVVAARPGFQSARLLLIFRRDCREGTSTVFSSI